MNEREALLAALRDPQPPLVGWWPPAPGWWLLGTLALLVLLGPPLAIWWRRRRERLHAERRARRRILEARSRLAGLRGQALSGDAHAVLSGASVLARQTLLAIRPRNEIAPLHGERWLRALDEASGGTAFTRGPGRLLASAPYRPDAALGESVGEAELGALLDTLERLIERAFDERAGVAPDVRRASDRSGGAPGTAGEERTKPAADPATRAARP